MSRGSPWRQVSRRIPSLCWEEAPTAKFTSGERTQDRGNVFHPQYLRLQNYTFTHVLSTVCLIGTHEFCIRKYITKKACQRAFFKDDFGTESYQAKKFRNHNTANAVPVPVCTGTGIFKSFLTTCIILINRRGRSGLGGKK